MRIQCYKCKKITLDKDITVLVEENVNFGDDWLPYCKKCIKEENK